jgi:hypothetical protein
MTNNNQDISWQKSLIINLMDDGLSREGAQEYVEFVEEFAIPDAVTERTKQVIEALSHVEFHDLNHSLVDCIRGDKTQKQEAIELVWSIIQKPIQKQLTSRFLDQEVGGKE